MIDTAPRRFERRLLWVMPIIGLTTQLIHEGAHWITGRALGYPVIFGLNAVTSPTPMTVPDHILMSLSGPLVTIAGAVGAFLWLLRRPSLAAYGVLFFALFMRLVAVGLSIFLLNDEARSSQLLGIGTWTLPALVVGALAFMTVIASRRLGLGWRINVGLYLICSVIVSAIVGADMMLRS